MKKLTLDYNQYSKLVSNICRDITNSNWRPDYVVGISRGGLLAATMISHYFKIPMHPLEVSLRDGGETVSNLGMAEDAFGYPRGDRKKILIVDDINDTGATFNWIMKDWPSGCFPNDPSWLTVWNDNVKFAVTIDNLASNCNVKMDYVGMDINKAEDDVWIEFPYEIWWQ
jgi:xanthine phosphoribosyltransferase